jgi:hypothetical protein
MVGRRRQKRSATRARPIQARVESSNGSVLLLLLLYGRAAMRLLTAGARGRWMDRVHHTRAAGALLRSDPLRARV